MSKRLIGAALAAALALGASVAAQAQSTINGNIPPPTGPLQSAPIRGEFQAAKSDINRLFGMSAGVSPPSAPLPFQFWANTAAPLAVINLYDGSQQVPIGFLDRTAHTFSPALSAASIAATAPVTATFVGSRATIALTIDPNLAVRSGALGLADALVIGAATGGAQGAGSVNAKSLYIDASAVLAATGTLTVGDCLRIVAGPKIGDSGAPCGAGSNDAHVQDFLTGSGFTPGTTTMLTLSSSPVNSNMLAITFDGVVQSHNTFALVGAAVTFNAAIPTGTQVVEAQWYTATTTAGVGSLNGLGGALNLVGTNGITITPSSLTLTLSPDGNFQTLVQPSSGNLTCQQNHQMLWADANQCLSADTIVQTSTDPSGLIVTSFSGPIVPGDVIDVLFSIDGGAESAAVYTVKMGDTLAQIGKCLVNVNYPGCSGGGNVGLQNLPAVYTCTPSGLSCPTVEAGQGGYGGTGYLGYITPFLNGFAVDANGHHTVKERFSIVGSIVGAAVPDCHLGSGCAAGTIALDNNPNVQYSRNPGFAPAPGSAIWAAYYVSSQSVNPTQAQTIYAQDAVYVYNSTTGSEVACRVTGLGSGAAAICNGPHFATTGTKPSMGSCPGGVASGNDIAGWVDLTGGGVGTGCTVLFSRLYPSRPSCVISEEGGHNDITFSTTISQINLFRTFGLSGFIVHWDCKGLDIG